MTLTALPHSAATGIETLPGIWRASELGTDRVRTISSGSAALDAALPGGGWPEGALTEILQPQPGLHEWRLLRTPLQEAARQGPVVLIGSPHQPYLAALSAQGLTSERLVLVDAATPAQRLWATEQALRCADIAAVLAWLPQVRAEQLRRLQLAAAGQARALAFVFRPLAAQLESSPAPLRVSVRTDGVAGLSVRLLKRRGPPLDQPLALTGTLPALHPARLTRHRLPVSPAPAPTEPRYAVDRLTSPPDYAFGH